MIGKIDYTKSDALDTPNKRTPWHRLLASESLLLLRKEWFTGNEFSASIPILIIKYNHPGLQYKNSFYLFKDQFYYTLAYYFAKSKTTKANVNKLLSDLLMTLFTEKLSYKNANEWMGKLLKIPWGIPEDKWIEYKFDVKSGVSDIA